MPRLTIIVPLMDQVDAFETTLASVLRYAGAQIEVLAVISGDYEDQYNILSEVHSVCVDSRLAKTPLGRAAQAVDSATSAWVYWLTPGVELTEDALDGALAISQRRDLGLASPRIVARSAQDESHTVHGKSAEHHASSLASSVVLTHRFHPVCLEELIGEQWATTDISSRIRVIGPTGWAGLVQRRLLEHWSRTDDAQLPNGYAELSLGLLVQQDGWAHDWISGDLIASESIAIEIESGYRLCGRSSNRILGISAIESRRSPTWMALRTSMSELAGGCLSPQLWRVVWERFKSRQSLRQTSPRKLTSATDSQFDGDQQRSASASHPTAANRSTLSHTKRLRSAA